MWCGSLNSVESLLKLIIFHPVELFLLCCLHKPHSTQTQQENTGWLFLSLFSIFVVVVFRPDYFILCKHFTASNTSWEQIHYLCPSQHNERCSSGLEAAQSSAHEGCPQMAVNSSSQQQLSARWDQRWVWNKVKWMTEKLFLIWWTSSLDPWLKHRKFFFSFIKARIKNI